MASPGAGSAIEDKFLALVDLGRAVLEGAEPQFRALQIDQDADRPVIFRLHGADARHQLTHPVVIGVAHIDAEHIGAGLEQPGNDGAIPGGRTERGDDLGAPLPSHRALKALAQVGIVMEFYFRSASMA